MDQNRIKSPEERKELRAKVSRHLSATSEVMALLDVKRGRVNQLVKEGKLKPLRHGVFLKDDIEAYLHAYREARRNNEWLKDFE